MPRQYKRPQRHTRPYDALTAPQLAAIQAFARENGRHWKRTLLGRWLRAAEPGALQQLRNSHGPEWLEEVCPAQP
jgi:hypothetical protein